MFLARLLASTLPCGNNASCETFAATNSIAEEFLHVATQAPHPIHAAASIASSASGFAIGMAFANIDKIQRFKGAGFEAEMKQAVEKAMRQQIL